MTGSLRPRLLVVRGGRTLAAREIAPGDDWRLGRHADSPLPLDERSISRAHVRITCDAAGVHLEDLGSPNGTFLDGHPLSGTVTLRDGNLVRLGQSTNPDPILVLFEDPGTRLLEAMRTDARTDAPGAGESGASDLTIESVSVPKEVRVSVPPAPEASGPEPERPQGPLALVGRHVPVVIAFAVLLAMGLVLALRATQKPWQTVRVEPMKVKAGGRVALRGSEVDPSDTLKVFVGEAEAGIAEMGPGQVLFDVPQLPGGEAGVHPVPLRVERKGIVLLRQTLQYETVPDIDEVEPAEAAVGDTVTLRGTGFLNDPARVKVRVGQQAALVLAATATEIRFRVPVVTRSVQVEAALDVQVAEWKTKARTLKVGPRHAPCFDLAFAARSVADRIWELRSAVGPVFFVEAGPAPLDGSLPAEVQKAVDTLAQSFTRAASDPTLRFEVRPAGRAPAVVAVGLGPAATEVGRWTPALAAYVHQRAPDVRQTELVPYWSSVVLNEYLNVFAKKQPPRLLLGSDPLRAALKRLVDLNVETGGQGCPSATEVQAMETGERELFETAALRLPARFGEVGGNWEGTLENVFAEKGKDGGLELRLELKQAGTTLQGRMLVYEVRGQGIRWSPPPVEGLEGSVKLGAETRVELKVPPQPPYFITRLSAVLAEESLDGTFVNDRRKSGRFHLVFKPGE